MRQVGEIEQAMGLPASLAAMPGSLQHGQPQLSPAGIVEVAHFRAERHGYSFQAKPRRSLGASARFWRVPR